jgi:hypothetical protein
MARVTAPAYTPPPRRSQKMRARVGGAVVLVALSALLMWVVVDLASNNPEEANLPGGETFVVGEADRFADRIEEQGPILFKDPLSSRPGREIYVLHDGGDSDEGWSAVLAYAPDARREVACILRWEAKDAVFVDPCGAETYEPDDDRLTRFVATVDDGKVEVDLRS